MGRTNASAPTLIAGPSAGPLTRRIGEELGADPIPARTEVYPDGEVDASVPASIRGHDVYGVQALAPTVNDHLVQLLMLLDACRRAGAGYHRRASGHSPH